MVWKKIDPRKFDPDREKELLVEIEKRKKEMENARVPMKQADGRTIRVFQSESVAAYIEASKSFHEWFLSCLEE